MFLQNSQRKIEEEFLKLTEKLGADREPLKTICEKLDGCGRELEAKGMSVTLHRAFDVCRDPMEALEQAISLGFNTILTSGQKNNCVDGSPLLAELVEKSSGRIHIMAGAGVNADVIAPIYEKTGITDYHMTGKVLLDSEMKYRKEGVSMGLPSLSEYEIFRTSEAEVKKAREVLARL